MNPPITRTPTHQPVNDQKKVARMALVHVLNVPGLGIFFSMLGFAAIARQAGFDLATALATTALVWGMPGQVAMASLYLAGASAFVIFIAVALANMRMMLMVVSAVEITGIEKRKMPLWKQIGIMKILAITLWIQIAAIREQIDQKFILTYYLVFGLTLYVLGIAGTVTGYFLIDLVPLVVMKTIVFTTPLYILMMISRIRERLFQYAALVGGIICPLLYPAFGEVAIFAAGFLGGTLVMLPRLRAARQVIRKRRKRHG